MTQTTQTEPSPTIDFMHEPHRMVEMTVAEMYALPVEAQPDFHLTGASLRFGELRQRLTVLDRVAVEQGVDELNSIEDHGPLLFPHSAYKSYPMKFLEENRFDRITRWLDGFTTADLSSIDASACGRRDALLMRPQGRLPSPQRPAVERGRRW